MIRIDLKMLLCGHVPHSGGVSQSLGLHNPFHVCSPTVLERPSLIHNKWIKGRNLWIEELAWDVTMQQGEETSRLETTTFSIFLSRMSFITWTLWCRSNEHSHEPQLSIYTIPWLRQQYLAEPRKLLLVRLSFLLFLFILGQFQALLFYINF